MTTSFIRRSQHGLFNLQKWRPFQFVVMTTLSIRSNDDLVNSLEWRPFQFVGRVTLQFVGMTKWRNKIKSNWNEVRWQRHSKSFRNFSVTMLCDQSLNKKKKREFFPELWGRRHQMLIFSDFTLQPHKWRPPWKVKRSLYSSQSRANEWLENGIITR
jgi:hypothetical protein